MSPNQRSLPTGIVGGVLILMTFSASYGAELEVQAWRCWTQHDDIHVEGTVKNISPEEMRHVTVVTDYLDKSGEIVEDSEALIKYRTLRPGQVSPFFDKSRVTQQIETCQIGFKKLLGEKISHTIWSADKGGMSGAEGSVAGRAQRLLNELGYDAGPVDGLMGPKTRAAIRAFEKAHGYAPTGALNEDLIVRLEQALPAARVQVETPSPTFQQATARHERVKEAQELLNKLGYEAGAATGFAGPKTRDAIWAFQRENTMAETGELSAELLRRLKAQAEP